MSPNERPSGDGFGWIVAAGGTLLVSVWAGAALAAALNGQPGRVRLADAGTAALALPGKAGNPKAAWPSPTSTALPGPAVYWAAQALVIAGAATAGAGIWKVKARLGRSTGPFGLDPDAGLASRRDLKRVSVRKVTPGRITVGRAHGRLIAAEPDASLAVVGPTGCGKTVGFAIPALLEWEGPVLATSVKGDLLDATIDHRRTKGKVWVYDPTGCSAETSAFWSPLASCKTWLGALRLANWMADAAQPRNDTLADGDYWYTQARKGLAPYLHAAAVTGTPLSTLVRWVDTQDEDEVRSALSKAARIDPSTGEVLEPGEGFDQLVDAAYNHARVLLHEHRRELGDLADAEWAAWPDWVHKAIAETVAIEQAIDQASGRYDPLAPLTSARALWKKDSRLKGSVFATIENVLSAWADPDVAAHAVGPAEQTIDIDEWLSGNNTIYVVAQPSEQARLRPVLTTLVQHALRRAYERANKNRGRLPIPCLALLDEAGNTAPLRDLPSYASTARSHGITFVTVWQDLAQIKATYRDRAQTVLNNHRAKLFGSGIADTDTLEYVSRLIGDEPHRETNTSFDVSGTPGSSLLLGGGRRSVSEHRSYRRVAAVDVVRRIPPGHGVLLYGADLPAPVRLRPWFKDRELAERGRNPDQP